MSKARDSFLIAIAAPTKGCFIGADHCVVPHNSLLGPNQWFMRTNQYRELSAHAKVSSQVKLLKTVSTQIPCQDCKYLFVGCRLKGKNGTTRRKPSRQYLPCSSIRHFRPFKVIQDSRLGSLWGLKGSSKPGNFG